MSTSHKYSQSECFEIMTFARSSLWGSGTSLVCTLPPLTPVCVSQCCSQLWTDQPLCPQHKHPSSFWGNGQNGFWSAQPAVCSLLGSRRETSGSCVPLLKCCYGCKLSSRQWNSSSLYKPKFNIGHKVLQLCHKTPQLALQKFSALEAWSCFVALVLWVVQRCVSAQQSCCSLFLILAT